MKNDLKNSKPNDPHFSKKGGAPCSSCANFNAAYIPSFKNPNGMGLCSKWSSVQFPNDTCNQYFTFANVQTWEELTRTLDVGPQVKQLDLFQ